MPARRAPSQNQAKKSSTRYPKLQVLSSEKAFQGWVFSVTSDRIIEPNGVEARRDVVRHSGSVVILAVDESSEEPRILLVRQYRYAARDYLWEVPAGRIDPGEDPLKAAKRELLEETGYQAKSWQKGLFFYPSPGFMDETMTVYLARRLQAGEAQPEEDEKIEADLVTLSTVLEMISSGTIRDGKTIASVLWLQAQRCRTK